MGGSFLSPVRVAVVLSLSLTACYTSSSLSPSSSLFIVKPLSSSIPAKPKASASDILSLLGSPQQAATIDPKEARQLRSCFKFLVPFAPAQLAPESNARPVRCMLGSKSLRNLSWMEENELIWWPPAPVMELARIAVDSGGDPGAIHRALDPTVIPVPDIEGSKEKRCQLTRTPYGRRFISEELNSYLEFLFQIIAARGPNIGLNISLNRYDFFHGHLFLATDLGRLGILFHAREYPAYDKYVFPYFMGYCQIGSNVTYDESMNLRNILWLAPLPSNSGKAWSAPGILVALDACPEGIIYRDLVPEYVKYVRTIYEDEFGDVAVDVNYLHVGGAMSDYQIFIC